MSNESLWAIIVLLIAAHYLSLIWELRKLRDLIQALTKQVADAAIAAANAATAAATLAGKK